MDFFAQRFERKDTVMAIRHLDPVTDHALMEREMERTEAQANLLVEFDDWTTLTCDGVTFDIRVTAWMKRKGPTGPISIDSLFIPAIEGIFVHIPNFPDPLPIEVGTLRRASALRYKRLENVVEQFLLGFALASNDWKPEDAV